MAVREIVLYAENEAALRKECEPVRVINRRIKKLMEDLKDTLANHPEGIGLAAPQINVHRRSEAGPPVALINPEIVKAGYEQRDFDGCLSFPGLFAETIRPHLLHITGLDEWGQPFEGIFGGFDAVVIHHEIDHLDGVLFIDRVERMEDLYGVRVDDNGHLVRVPVSVVGT
jgi:peptide deformylase